ncbi:MAG TPA: hypothetical protein VHY08_04530, partial [Bacillota bacterium]|nr:hypothetical protein [Bacillota bacterium]
MECNLAFIAPVVQPLIGRYDVLGKEESSSAASGNGFGYLEQISKNKAAVLSLGVLIGFIYVQGLFS